jgi:acetyl esterase
MADYHTPPTRSYRENGEGYFLTARDLVFFWGLYLRDARDAADPRAVPLKARDVMKLPPALVITAEYDPLRDGGEAYAVRLREAGVPTTLTRYDGAIHGFIGLPDIDLGKRGLQECCAWLSARFR